jgi:hypothetical protein
MCGSVTLLLRRQTNGTLLRPANQARLAISARAVDLKVYEDRSLE